MSRFFILMLLFLSSCSLRTYPVYFSYVDEINRKFICQAVKNDHLIPFGLGGGGSGDVKTFSFSFQKVGFLNLDETRILLVTKAEQLLKIINENKRVRPYLHDYPATGKNVEITISFIKSELESYPPPPNIAFSMLIDDKVVYSVRKNDKFEDIFREPYETALLWVKDNASWALEEALSLHESSCLDNKALKSRIGSLFGI